MRKLLFNYFFYSHPEIRNFRVGQSSWAGAGLADVHLSRAPASSFEGFDVGGGREWVAQCHGVTPAIPHSAGTVPGMPAQRRVGRTASESDSQVVSMGWRHRGSPLT
jgi:hypothetical protein